MSQAISIDTTPLRQLDSALEEIAKLGKRRPAQLISRALADIVLGASAKNAAVTGGVAYSGLFGEFYDLAPQAGEITRDRAVDSWRVTRDAQDTRLAVQQARQMLAGKHSGVFQIRYGSAGQLLMPKQVFTVFSRRKGPEQKVMGSRAKLRKGQTSLAVQAEMFSARARSYYKSHGYTQMNTPALVAALTVSAREHFRFATAAQFRGLKQRDFWLMNVNRSLTGSYSTSVRNKKGKQLGNVSLSHAPGSAQGRILGLEGVAPRFAHRVDSVLAHVVEDRMLYLARHLQKDVRALLDGRKAP